MEAKDTVMNILSREKLYDDWASNPFNDKTEEWIKNIILDVAQIQAEISFKAGIREGMERLREEVGKMEVMDSAKIKSIWDKNFSIENLFYWMRKSAQAQLDKDKSLLDKLERMME